MDLYKGQNKPSFANAVSLYQSGKSAQAQDILKIIIKQNPVNHQALDFLGTVSLENKNYKAAIKFTKRAINIVKTSPRYILNYAIALCYSGQIKKSIFILANFSEKNPGNGNLIISLGDVFLGSQQYEKATSVFVEATKFMPENPELYMKLGMAHQVSGNFNNAQNAYKKAILMGGISADVHCNLGSIYLLQDELELGISEFKKAISLDPNHHRSHQSIGQEFSRRGKYHDAIPYLRRAVSTNPKDIASICELANALANTGQPAASVEVCEEALKKFPNQINILVQSAFSFFIAQKYQKVISSCKKALTISPGNISALAFLSSALNEIGNRDEASLYLNFEELIETNMISPSPAFPSLCEFNTALEDTVYRHPTLEVKESNRSLSQGLCTSNLFDGNETPALIHLREKIFTSFQNYLKKRPIDVNHPYLFRHPTKINLYCWANIIEEGGFHDVHFHPTAWLSGVYYPKLPEEIKSSHIECIDGCLEFGRSYYRLKSSDDPPVHLIKPKEGLIVLTPSYFGHRTIPFKSLQKRMSIAFDIIPESFT